METPALKNFMKTSKRNFDICYRVWHKRHQDQIRQLKDCLKDFVKGTGLSLYDIYRLSTTGNVSGLHNPEPEFLTALNQTFKNFDAEVIREIDPVYSEDAALERGEEWDEALFEKVSDEVNYKHFSALVDSLNSEQSLISLQQAVRQYAINNYRPFKPCLKMKFK